MRGRFVYIADIGETRRKYARTCNKNKNVFGDSKKSTAILRGEVSVGRVKQLFKFSIVGEIVPITCPPMLYGSRRCSFYRTVNCIGFIV